MGQKKKVFYPGNGRVPTSKNLRGKRSRRQRLQGRTTGGFTNLALLKKVRNNTGEGPRRSLGGEVRPSPGEFKFIEIWVKTKKPAA